MEDAASPSTSTPTPLLVRRPGDDSSRSVTGRTRIGRAADSDLVLDHPAVSEQHAQLVVEDGRWWLRDVGSTNGLIVDGRRVREVSIEAGTRVRFGPTGPVLVLTPDPGTGPRSTEAVAITEQDILDRYFRKDDPDDMGHHTAMMRTVVRREHHRRVRPYRKVVAVLVVATLTAGAVLFRQRRELERQRTAAAELFYGIKELELQLASLELDSALMEGYRRRQASLESRYHDYVEELGIYGSGTPPEDQLVYQTVRNLGESEVGMPDEFLREVRRSIKRWRTSDRLARAMARATEHRYGPRIADIMLASGLPPEFFYLAVQESDLNTTAVGPSTRYGFAKGMWQLMPGTARDLGLHTGPLVGQPRPDPRDDRHDFEKSTRAAARYLKDLYRTDAQASGLLVIASYNWGQNNVLKLIRSMPPTPKERNFWKLLARHRDRIPRETYQYVLNVVAAAAIGQDPARFGFDFDPPLDPTADAGTTLAVRDEVEPFPATQP